MRTIRVSTKKREDFVDITADINRTVERFGIDSGLCIVFCPHTTAALTINENADPAVKKDITDHLVKMVPQGKGYAHRERNSDSHIKASILGSSLNIIIEGGKLALGTWQGVYFCEFDGPRNRVVYAEFVKGG